MATKVRSRSVGILILSLGPAIFSRGCNTSVDLPPWRALVLRMRLPSPKPRSQMAAQVRGSFLRRPVELEGRDEAAVLVHQIGDGGMVHGIAAAVDRHLLEIGAVFLGHRRDRGQLAGEASDVWVEARQVVLEHALGVAFRVDRDEYGAGAVGVGPSAWRTCDMSYSVVGHTSGQLVKPKKTSDGLPSESRSVTVRPSWSVS